MDTVILAPAGYLLDPDLGSDYERPWRLAKGLAARGFHVIAVAREVKRTDELGSNVEISAPPGRITGSPTIRLFDRAVLYWHSRNAAARAVSSGRVVAIHHVGPCGEQSPSFISRPPTPFVYGPVPARRPAGLTRDEWVSWLKTPNARRYDAHLSSLVARPLGHIGNTLWRRTMARADAVTVEARSAIPTIRPDARIIPPGIDTERFTPDDGTEMVKGRIVAVGSLLYRKGFDVLIKAMARVTATYPGAHLLIVGAGVAEQPLRQLAEDSGVSFSTTFVGEIPRIELPRLLRTAELFCHPSRFDTFPLAVLEAMASGLPCLVSSCGALPEIVSAAGRVHPVGDHAMLAADILEVLGKPVARRRLAEAARVRIEEHFTWPSMCDAYARLYLSLSSLAAG